MKFPAHEVLVRLFRDDPQSFEILRHELIESLIDGAPARMQPHLRQIQFRVDCIRRLSRSPLGATLKINALMWGSFFEMNDRLQELAGRPEAPLGIPRGSKNIRPDGSAHVIELRRNLTSKYRV